MTKYTYKTENPSFNIVVEAENKQIADERYQKIFNKDDDSK